ncbi:MAG: ABC transporter ATP-binding protein [Candidatus Helarchaeota archaeon]
MVSMDRDVAIKVEHVSKKFCKSLKRSMIYGLFDITRNVFGRSSHSERLRKSEFWAIDDISFDVRTGEVLGIIGPNGSGKTTILKLLNGIFWPDKGKITIRGRVGALIEVGAGFHPLLSGRRNIYLNGAILGMSKSEIDKKFDSIIEFANIGDFIDTPIKYYSSGMYVRLGFAIAAHCEPDILLIDEVLAVGDLKFQSKCFNFISENVLHKETTVIFVSHNRYAVQDVCDNVLYLKNGKIIQIGDKMDVIERYLKDIVADYPSTKLQDPSMSQQKEGITKVIFLDKNNNSVNKFKSGEEIRIRFYYYFKKQIRTPSVGISLFHMDPRYRIVSNTDYIFNVHSGYDGLAVSNLKGHGYFEVKIKQFFLPIGRYQYSIYLFKDNNMNLIEKHENAGEIEILWLDESPKRSLIELPHKWTVTEDE